MSGAHGSPGERPACFPDLRGQAVLVTGGGTGIGRGIAQRLAREGMRVAICGRRPGPLEETAGLIAAAGGEAVWVPADVGDPEQAPNLFAQITARLGPVDAVVHNAMRMAFPTFEDCTLEEWEASFATGTRAAFLLAKHALPGMRERGRGAFVLVSSVLAQRPNRRGLPYHAVKGALEAMTRQMAIAWAREGIRVNALAPGLIAAGRSFSRQEAAHEAIPLGRAGTPAEMGAVVAFLLSEQSSYIVGQVIHADGGTSIQLAPAGIPL